MTPISLTLNATTEQHAIADFVNKILAQFKKTPNVMLQVHINDEPWVARDFVGGMYLTVGTVEQYQENKLQYEALISEDATSPVYHEYFQHLRINGDVGETVSPVLKGYEHHQAVMAPEILIDAIARMLKQ